MLHQRRCSQGAGGLLLFAQDHFLALTASLGQRILLCVLADVLVAPLERHELLPLDLPSLHDWLGHMALALDSANLGHVRVALDQRLIVLELCALAAALDAAAVGGLGAP